MKHIKRPDEYEYTGERPCDSCHRAGKSCPDFRTCAGYRLWTRKMWDEIRISFGVVKSNERR